jgi:uncharacterized protein YdhG (YjbR/CyaY superfamily)
MTRIGGDMTTQATPPAGEKGNLRFPLDQPIPYDLIERIVTLRVAQNVAKAEKGKKGKGAKTR